MKYSHVVLLFVALLPPLFADSLTGPAQASLSFSATPSRLRRRSTSSNNREIYQSSSLAEPQSPLPFSRSVFSHGTFASPVSINNAVPSSSTSVTSRVGENVLPTNVISDSSETVKSPEADAITARAIQQITEALDQAANAIAPQEQDKIHACLLKIRDYSLWAIPKICGGIIGGLSASGVSVLLTPVIGPIGAAAVSSGVGAILGPSTTMAMEKLQTLVIAKMNELERKRKERERVQEEARKKTLIERKVKGLAE